MVDLAKKFREPIEVYEAARGNSQPLADRLRSDAPLQKLEREALACLVEGKLLPPPKKQGGAIPKYMRGGVEYLAGMMLPNAEARYQHIRQQLKAEGKFYGTAEDVLEYVAKTYLVLPEASDEEVYEAVRKLRQYMDRSRTAKDKLLPQLPSNAVEEYHYWLWRQGHIQYP